MIPQLRAGSLSASSRSCERSVVPKRKESERRRTNSNVGPGPSHNTSALQKYAVRVRVFANTSPAIRRWTSPDGTIRKSSDGRKFLELHETESEIAERARKLRTTSIRFGKSGRPEHLLISKVSASVRAPGDPIHRLLHRH